MRNTTTIPTELILHLLQNQTVDRRAVAHHNAETLAHLLEKGLELRLAEAGTIIALELLDRPDHTPEQLVYLIAHLRELDAVRIIQTTQRRLDEESRT